MPASPSIDATNTDPAEADYAATAPQFSRKRHVEQVRRLSQVNGWRSTLLIAGVWVPIVVAMAWAVWAPHWWVYLIAACVIASRLVAMGVLVHDAVHYALYKNHLVNDVIADLFLAFPIGMTTGLYRRTHLIHHRYTNTEDDLDLVTMSEDHEWFEWPKEPRAMWGVIARSLTGLNAHRGWLMYKHWAPWNHLRDPLTPYFPLHTRVLYLFNMAAVYCLIGWGFSVAPWETGKLVALFTIPSLTLVNFAMRIRATAEHLGADNTEELRASRTVLPRWWERWLIAPVNVNHHLEHHLFPSVPGPNLRKLHQVLMQDDEFRARAHLTQGYDGVLRELMSGKATTTEPPVRRPE